MTRRRSQARESPRKPRSRAPRPCPKFTLAADTPSPFGPPGGRSSVWIAGLFLADSRRPTHGWFLDRSAQEVEGDEGEPEEPHGAPDAAGNARSGGAKRGAGREQGGSREKRREPQAAPRGRRLNAKASTKGVRSSAVAVIPDSILCAEECQDVLSQPASMPWQSSRKSPSRNMPVPPTNSPRTPSERGTLAERGPKTESEPRTRMPVRFAATWL